MIGHSAPPLVPPGWEGAAGRLIRLADPAGGALAWLVNDPGANCVGFAVRQPAGWVQLLDAGSPEALAERPTRFGCAVLFPFPGHVRGGHYRWGAAEHTLAPLGPGQGDYAHGFAPRLPWRVAQTDDASATFEFLTTRDLPGGARAAGYPFAVRLHLSVRLAGGALRLALAATNEGERPAPVGLGLHPYFAIAALGGDRAAVRADLPGRFAHVLAARLPTGERRPVADPEVRLPPLGQLLHAPRAALGAAPVATLRGAASDPTVRLTCLEGVRELLLFAPATENSVSIEPLNCAPGAVSQAEGHPDALPGLAPGATQRLAVAIAVA